MTGYIRGAMNGVNGNLAPKLHKRRSLAFLRPIQAHVDGAHHGRIPAVFHGAAKSGEVR
jgi:hypothetical protein